jgi:predicted nucleotidyltransferase
MNRKQVEEIASKIVEKFNPKRIVLFGSHARGEATDDSDVDLFVEMESDRRPPERAIEVNAMFGLRPWPLDVVVYTPAEVERLRNVRGTLLSVIEAEGEVLYERPSEQSVQATCV